MAERDFPFFAFGNVARGWIAVGNVAYGVVAIGFSLSVGVVSIGMNAVGSVVAIGLNSFGLVSVSLINAVGVLAFAGVNALGAFGHGGVNAGFGAPGAVVFAAVYGMLLAFPKPFGEIPFDAGPELSSLEELEARRATGWVAGRLVSVDDERLHANLGGRTLALVPTVGAVLDEARAKVGRRGELLFAVQVVESASVANAGADYRRAPEAAPEHRCAEVVVRPRRKAVHFANAIARGSVSVALAASVAAAAVRFLV